MNPLIKEFLADLKKLKKEIQTMTLKTNNVPGPGNNRCPQPVHVSG